MNNKEKGNTILLSVNGERFIIESKEKLTQEKKDIIDLICCTAFDEDSEFVSELGEGGTLDDLYELSNFEFADLLQKILHKNGIDVVFKCIDLEVAVRFG